MKYTREQLTAWVEKIEGEGKGLTSWEKDFIESIKEQLRRGRNLSDLQEERLERIYAEKTP